ncbi:MAG TPA: GRP family sugar transporter [Candidatus Saccharimonadales bacterium]
MGFLYLLIAVFVESAGKTVDKLNFRRNRIAAQQMMLLVFFAMSVLLGLFVYLTHQPFPHFTLVALGLTALIALVSFGSNVFDVLSLRADDLSLREPLSDFQPIVAGLVGYALFPGERKPGFLLAFILGAVIVYWGSHRRKLRRLQAKGMYYLLLGVCLEALLPSIYKVTLSHLSPSYIALFRLTAVLLLTGLFFPAKGLRKMSAKKVNYSFAAGLAYAVGAVASLYAIKELGVVLTMLLSLLGPFLRYLASYFILKENIRKGEIISSILLAGVVLIPIFK